MDLYTRFGVYIPMRHAARTPPPLNLVACGLLRRRRSRKSQNVMCHFVVNRSYLVVFWKFIANSPVVFCIEFGA